TRIRPSPASSWWKSAGCCRNPGSTRAPRWAPRPSARRSCASSSTPAPTRSCSTAAPPRTWGRSPSSCASSWPDPLAEAPRRHKKRRISAFFCARRGLGSAQEKIPQSVEAVGGELQVVCQIALDGAGLLGGGLKGGLQVGAIEADHGGHGVLARGEPETLLEGLDDGAREAVVHMAGREQIIGDDVLVGDTQGLQQDAHHETRPILAGGAVNQHRDFAILHQLVKHD